VLSEGGVEKKVCEKMICTKTSARKYNLRWIQTSIL